MCIPTEFNSHLLSVGQKNKAGSLKFLDDIRFARMDYYSQSCGSPYRIRDEEFMWQMIFLKATLITGSYQGQEVPTQLNNIVQQQGKFCASVGIWQMKKVIDYI